MATIMGVPTRSLIITAQQMEKDLSWLLRTENGKFERLGPPYTGLFKLLRL